MIDNNVLADVRKTFNDAQRILITSHTRPDGDAIGSVLGLGLALRNAGKEVQLALVDGVPKAFRHLQGYELIRKRPDGEFDVTVVVDCSSLDRVGSVMEHDSIPTINIDHHTTNLDYATYNIVDKKATATAEILAEYFEVIGLEITQPIAEALLTGLLTDTLGFRTTNMRPNALRAAADLMEFGCDLPVLYRQALLDRSYQAVKYWGTGLNTLQLEDRLLWTELTFKNRRAIGYPGRDDADLINVMSSINDVDIAVIFIEQGNGTIKVSWRARAGFDVSKVAFSFGGGGHKPAAGAEIEGELDQVKADVLHATRQLLLENELQLN